MQGRADIREIVAGLAARAPALCRDLFPAGRREGAEFRIGNLAGEPGRSMAIHLGGDRAGIWSDFASGDKGDALDLVALAVCRGDKSEALRWARAWLGIDGAPAPARRAPPPPPSTQSPEADTGRRKAAFRLWLECDRRLAGTPVERYLAGRGLDIKQLGRQPGALRYHPRLPHGPTGQSFPAMVAAITGPDGSLFGVHRTYLAAAAGGRVGKAPVQDPKMTLGAYRGGCIRLWRGKDRKPLDAAPDGSAVTVTEGIEDGLTVALACPERRVLVAVSLANMGALWLPPSVMTVTVAVDNDGGNEAARRGLDRSIRHFQSGGRRVFLVRSPVGKDLNDFLVRAA